MSSDQLMRLEWHQDTLTLQWDEAAKAAETLGDGWRLPFVYELMGQFDFLSGKIADGFLSGYYWTSSPVKPDPSRAWCVFLGNTYADVCDYFKTAFLFVRYVREIPTKKEDVDDGFERMIKSPPAEYSGPRCLSASGLADLSAEITRAIDGLHEGLDEWQFRHCVDKALDHLFYDGT